MELNSKQLGKFCSHTALPACTQRGRERKERERREREKRERKKRVQTEIMILAMV